MLPKPDFVAAEKLLDPAFVKLRAEADLWQAARTAFMMKRLKEGRHPDTDPHFWDGYTERPAPTLPPISVPDAYHMWRRMQERLILTVFLGIPVLAIAWLAGRSARARQRKVKMTDDPSPESTGGCH
jgi:hypothetical protein